MDQTPLTPQPAPPPAGAPIAGAPAPLPPTGSGASHRRGILIGGIAALSLGVAASGAGVAFVAGDALGRATASSPTSTVEPGIYHRQGGPGGQGQQSGPGDGSFGGYGFGSGDASPSATPATAAQKQGVVTVVSQLGYDGSSEAAGTGIILSSDGEILTNNHVVEGSTAIEVTVESTDVSYTAKVVGTDATDDVAVLQLVDANGDDVTGLTAAHLDHDGLAVGDAVTDVGNAEGTGNLVVATGTVTALDQSIQVADETTGAQKSLAGLVELDADIVSGDSGGPVLDSEGEVAAIATAASSGTSDVTGYAIPIETAMAVVDRIVAGDASGTVTIGLPAFLGVELSQQQGGAGVTVAGVIDGMPAAQAGIAAGSVITAVDGTPASTADALSSAIAAHAAGDRVMIAWTDASGTAQQATVTLVAGPAA
jgi:S1-C subfamily serine protease